MSLAEDFGMYYSGTYIGIRHEGKIVPFYVEAIDHDSSVINYRGMSESDRQAVEYSDEGMNALRFHGIIAPTGNESAMTVISHADDLLVFDLPDPKYIHHRGRYLWVTYRAQRSTKKGLSSRRVSGVANFTGAVAAALFDDTPDPNIIGGCMVRQGSDLHYKGVPVADLTVSGGIITNVSLFAEAKHLAKFIEREIPSCQVDIQTGTGAA